MSLLRESMRCSRTTCGAVWLSVAAFGLAGCGSLETDTSLSAAQVRFVQVSPGAAEMDFYVNGTGAAYNVGFANFTSYQPVSPGLAGISANRAGSGQALVAMQSALSGGHQYTAVVSHPLGNLQERVYQDMDTPAAAGQIALRVLNEVEGSGTLAVYVAAAEGRGGTNGPATVLNVGSGGSSAYTTLPANGSYVVSATVTEAGLSLPVSTVTVKAAGGAVRTVVFAGVAQTGGHGVVGFALNDVDVP